MKYFFGCGPLSRTLTTGTITCFLGDSYKPSFATVTERGHAQKISKQFKIEISKLFKINIINYIKLPYFWLSLIVYFYSIFVIIRMLIHLGARSFSAEWALLSLECKIELLVWLGANSSNAFSRQPALQAPKAWDNLGKAPLNHHSVS